MKIIKIISSVLFVGMLTACLKSTDNNFVNTGATGSPNAISFQNITGTGPYGYNLNTKVDQTIGAVSSITPVTFQITAQLTSTDGSYPATSVTIDNTPAVVSQYNSDQLKLDSSFQVCSVLPDSTFSWVNKTATVDPTTHIATFTFSLNSSKVDLSQIYALGVSIVSVSNTGVAIPSNTSTKVLLVKIKNLYDANYTVTGYFFHPTAASCRAINMTKSLTTVSSKTCSAGLADLEKSYGYRFQFDTDPITNKLTSWAIPSGNGSPAPPASGFMNADNPGSNNPNYTAATGFISKTYNNTYDPANQIYWMHFGYASGGNGQNTWTRQIYEKWVRQ